MGPEWVVLGELTSLPDAGDVSAVVVTAVVAGVVLADNVGVVVDAHAAAASVDAMTIGASRDMDLMTSPLQDPAVGQAFHSHRAPPGLRSDRVAFAGQQTSMILHIERGADWWSYGYSERRSYSVMTANP